MYPPDDRVLVCLWPFGFDAAGCTRPIYWYGVLIVLGMILGAYVASKEAQHRGINVDHVWGALTWALIFGVLGARLYHALTPPPSMAITAWDYLRFADLSPQDGIPDILEIWNGGLGIPGGIAGGLLGVWIYCRRNKLAFLSAADLAAVAMPLGQAIGRWGNFFNQELYGGPTTMPLGLRIDAWARVPPYDNLALYPVETTRFHPAFLYESLWNLLAFGAVLYAARRKGGSLLRGELFALYVALYAAGRVLTETVRADSPIIQVGGLTVNINQTLAILALLVVAAVVWLRRNRLASGAVTPKAEQGPDGNVDRIALSDAAYADAAGAEYEEEDEDGDAGDEDDEEEPESDEEEEAESAAPADQDAVI
jgi:phosphatidylglycerol:prolipoprotein diacylglycerol transferase